MTQQTSEQRRGQPKGPLVTESEFDELFGVDNRRPGHCQEHGDFIELHFSGKRGKKAGWGGCPECDLQEHAARQRREELERQAAMYRERVECIVRKSGIPGRFISKTFDDYQPATQKAARNLQRVREYAEQIAGGDAAGRCLLMLGKVGTGKTHLGCALAASVIRATGKPCKYIAFSELVRQVKGSFSSNSGYSEQDVYAEFARPLLVVLDEVGMQNFTEFEQAVAYEAINARYLAERSTVLISNLQAKDLPICIGERTVDRLREGGGRALDFDWDSYRAGGAA